MKKGTSGLTFNPGIYQPTYVGTVTPPEPVIYSASVGCSRCGAPLNNVSPGYSIVAGGKAVCANCLQPNEEILRAKEL